MTKHIASCCCDDCRAAFMEALENKTLQIKLQGSSSQLVQNFAREWGATPEQVIEGLIGLQIYCEGEYSGKSYIKK